ncbi:MAG: hypothetical protein ACE5GB_04915 [Acidimicrobiales bacterium]
MTTKGVPARVGGLHLERAGDELLVYNPADHTAHAVNHIASVVLDACDGRRSTAELVDVVGGRVDTMVDHEVIALAVSDLLDAGLITMDGPVRGVSRRSLIARVGVGAAAIAAIPVVESITAPSPAAAMSPGPETDDQPVDELTTEGT